MTAFSSTEQLTEVTMHRRETTSYNELPPAATRFPRREQTGISTRWPTSFSFPWSFPAPTDIVWKPKSSHSIPPMSTHSENRSWGKNAALQVLMCTSVCNRIIYTDGKCKFYSFSAFVKFFSGLGSIWYSVALFILNSPQCIIWFQGFCTNATILTVNNSNNK